MLHETLLRRELAWVAKRVVLVVGIFVAFLAAMAWIHLSEADEIPFALFAFVFAHLWLLAWLSFTLKLVHEHGVPVALQIRWRESNKLLIHFSVRPLC